MMFDDMTYSDLESKIKLSLDKMILMWDSMSKEFSGKKIELYEVDGSKAVYLINSVELSDSVDIFLDLSLIGDVFNSKWYALQDIKDRCVRIFI